MLLDNDALTQPMRIGVAADGRLLYIERDGRVKIWNPQTQSTTVAGSVATAVLGETGLIGLALAPDFAQTGHIYLHRSLPDYRTSWTARVSRFTITPDNRLDPASEVPIIDIPHPPARSGGHDAGDLLAPRTASCSSPPATTRSAVSPTASRRPTRARTRSSPSPTPARRPQTPTR